MATQFFRIEKDQSLFDFWTEQVASNLSELAYSVNLEDLLNIGAIYVNQTRISDAQNLKAGDLLRIHFRPKRYCKYKIASEKLVCGETEDLLIVHKPAGIPVHATLDNSKENLMQWLISDLGLPLFNTHRLDVGTQGLLIFAKNLKAATRVHRALVKQTISKKYVALVSSSSQLGLGEMKHWMLKSNRQPKTLSAIEKTDHLECRMEILETDFLKDSRRISIRLLTGRTHQIRAQLSFAGAPIIGDRLYGSELKYKSHSWTEPSQDSWALACTELEFENQTWQSFRSEEFQII